jgi:hypothetical protein
MHPKEVQQRLEAEKAYQDCTKTTEPSVQGLSQSPQSPPEPDAKSILRFRLDYFTANITRRLVDIQGMRDRLEYCSEREAKMLLNALDSRVFDGSIERL